MNAETILRAVGSALRDLTTTPLGMLSAVVFAIGASGYLLARDRSPRLGSAMFIALVLAAAGLGIDRTLLEYAIDVPQYSIPVSGDSVWTPEWNVPGSPGLVASVEGRSTLSPDGLPAADGLAGALTTIAEWTPPAGLPLAVLPGSKATASAQATLFCVTLRLEFPEGGQRRDMDTPSGRATATVQIKQGNAFPTFSLDVSIGDRAAGLVRVSIRDQRTGQVVDEFDLQAGGAAFHTRTTPSFALALVRIFERAGRCSTT